MAEPQWMIHARSFIGTKETKGSKHNPLIVAWFKESGHSGVKDDETSWCAAFTNAMLVRAGIAGTGSLAARSYMQWGKALDKPIPGCLAVFWRGSKASWQGHVGFFVSETRTQVRVLGGNQGNAVSIANYAKSRLLGYRWPSEVAPAVPVPKPVAVKAEYSKAQIRDIQTRLLGHGYVKVGGIDGLVGDNTRGAIRDFRAKNGLPAAQPPDYIDEDLIAALKRADAVRPVIDPERANATVETLKEKGSVIAKSAGKQKRTVEVATGGVVAVETANRLGILDSIGPAIAPVKEFGAEYGVWILIAVIVVMAGIVWYQARQVQAARLRDHRSGNTSMIDLPQYED